MDLFKVHIKCCQRTNSSHNKHKQSTSQATVLILHKNVGEFEKDIIFPALRQIEAQADNF